MRTLKEVYLQLVCSVDMNTRHVSIMEIDDVISINLDCLYERDYSSRGADQLIYLLHKIGKGKRFLFITEDGANIALSGAKQIIENVIDCFNLNEDTCAVICREKLVIPGARVYNFDSIVYWCHVLYPVIKTIDIPIGPFPKKFAAWFNRAPWHRVHLARHLYENYKEQSFISYKQVPSYNQYQDHMVVDRMLRPYFQDEIAWTKENTPIVYDEHFSDMNYGPLENIVGGNRKPYNEYFMEVAAETDTLSTNWITEKTVKNLYIGKPFVVMGGVGILERLRSVGFQTFSPYINETYDTIKNNHDRLEAIKSEIDRIAKLSDAEIMEVHNNLMPVFQHNRRIFKNLSVNRHFKVE